MGINDKELNHWSAICFQKFCTKFISKLIFISGCIKVGDCCSGILCIVMLKNVYLLIISLLSYEQEKHISIQGDHLSAKPGNVRQCDSCQGNVRDFTKTQGNVWEKILLGKVA